MAHATTKAIEIVSPKATLTPCILDDDPAQLELLTEQVGILGYEAIPTSDPDEALQLIRSGRCRMVFADVHMPGMNGYEFLDEALRCDPGVHVIIMTGDYTRYGRVTELLAAADDRAVIFGKGEEVTLEFAVKGLPATPKGSVRSFVLRTSGWCKDMDPHTARGETVEPLPFRSMTAYPYAEGETYPDDPAHARYRKEWNTRHLDGR